MESLSYLLQYPCLVVKTLIGRICSGLK